MAVTWRTLKILLTGEIAAAVLDEDDIDDAFVCRWTKVSDVLAFLAFSCHSLASDVTEFLT